MKGSMNRWSASIVACCFFDLCFFTSSLADTIIPNQRIQDRQTIVSAGRIFELGFFSPQSSNNRYVGIWYHDLQPQTVVWVANREVPLTDSAGVLTLQKDGNLMIFDGKRKSVWSTNTSSATNSTATLEDSGNLILRGRNSTNQSIILWQSFDYQTDTVLQGMKLGTSKLSSWKNSEDPSPGNFAFQISQANTSRRQQQLSISRGSDLYWLSGTWNGTIFQNIPMVDENFLFHFKSMDNKVFTYSSIYKKTRLVMDMNGQLKFFIWYDMAGPWRLAWWIPMEECSVHAACGGYGICTDSTSFSSCSCLTGFEPASPDDWKLGDWSRGCARRKSLCGKDGEEDGFLPLKLKTRQQSFQAGRTEDCRKVCLSNCGCTAYRYTNESSANKSKCLIWHGDLMDLRTPNANDVEESSDIFVRLASSEIYTGSHSLHSSTRRRLLSIIVPVTTVIGILLLATFFWVWRRTFNQRGSRKAKDMLNEENFSEYGKKDLDVPFFDFPSIAIATSNFSDSNKLGQGGFGHVYKGVLPGGQEIAVKRLSKCSEQGLEEFENEVELIAKLQHINLVKLIGYCIQGDEKMLLYEYMPNKSLDYFLFDQNRRSLLDWEKRYNIILGIARGLLYLHQDSRLRIIHRDLKPSNILLDEGMTPKISDFGMATLFGGNQTQRNSGRVVGTVGYISPEYALDGLSSLKSDVFGFGVLLLEIISGKKSTGFYDYEHSLSLLGHAWRLWKEEKGLELMDPLLNGVSNIEDVLKCIHVGLLCVQEDPTDRPTMCTVVVMLVKETANLSTPKQPAFYTRESLSTVDSCSNGPEVCSKNEMTISKIEGR